MPLEVWKRRRGDFWDGTLSYTRGQKKKVGLRMERDGGWQRPTVQHGLQEPWLQTPGNHWHAGSAPHREPRPSFCTSSSPKWSQGDLSVCLLNWDSRAARGCCRRKHETEAGLCYSFPFPLPLPFPFPFSSDVIYLDELSTRSTVQFANSYRLSSFIYLKISFSSWGNHLKLLYQCGVVGKQFVSPLY